MAMHIDNTVSLQHPVRPHGAHTKIEYNVKDGSLPSGAFTMQQQYTNYTTRMIYVKNQGNAVFAIHPERRAVSNHAPHLEIRITYHVRCSDSMLATRDLVTSMLNEGVTVSKEADCIVKCIQEYIRVNQDRSLLNNFTFVKVIRLPEEELNIADKCYVRELDLVASAHKHGMLSAHPNSNEGFSQNNLDAARIAHTHGGVMVTVVDNKHEVPMYFMYAGKQIIEIPTIVDHKRDSGVYSWVSTKGKTDLVPNQAFMTVQEAREKLGLYASRYEAESNGNPERLLEAEEARLKSELKHKEREIQVSKHDNQLEMLQEEKLTAMTKTFQAMLNVSNAALEEAIRRQNDTMETLMKAMQEAQKESFARRDLERKDLYAQREASRKDYYGENDLVRKDELERMKAEYDRKEKKRKNHYEKQSTLMKVVSEGVKLLPGILLGLGAVFMVQRSRSTA